MANVLYILDIISGPVEFKWFIVEIVYAADSANVNFSKIRKTFELGLAFFLFSLNLEKTIKFLIHSLRMTGKCSEIEKLPNVIVILVKF